MKRYELVYDNGAATERCKKAVEVKLGFLHYELADGTIGLARPGKWREVQPRSKANV